MSKKDLLKKKAKGKLATSTKLNKTSTLSVAKKSSELDKITYEIKSNLDELQEIINWWKVKKERVNELKLNIIEKLMYVRDKRKALLGSRTFEDYLNIDIGISKGYFYEQIQAYNVCVEYRKPGLFKKVDHKVLVNIAREKDKEKQRDLIEKAPSLSREDFKKVSPTDFSGNSAVSIDRERLLIRVPDTNILQTIEQLLRDNGIVIDLL